MMNHNLSSWLVDDSEIETWLWFHVERAKWLVYLIVSHFETEKKNEDEDDWRRNKERKSIKETGEWLYFWLFALTSVIIITTMFIISIAIISKDLFLDESMPQVSLHLQSLSFNYWRWFEKGFALISVSSLPFILISHHYHVVQN